MPGAPKTVGGDRMKKAKLKLGLLALCLALL